MIASIGSAFNGILAVVLVLGACIFFHELGHFTLAKLMGMKVEEFAMGFGRALWGFKRGETSYRVNLIPLGGYVRIAGMEPGAEPDPRGFYAFARWKGALVLVAGSIMNVVLAALAFIAVTVASGIGVFPGSEIAITKVLPDTPSQRAGIEPGDKIVAIDGMTHSLLLTDAEPGGLASRAGLSRYDRVYEVGGDPIDLPYQLAERMIAAQHKAEQAPPASGEAQSGEAPAAEAQSAAEEPGASAPAGPSVEVEVARFAEDGAFKDTRKATLPVPPGLPDRVTPAEAGPLLQRTLGVTLAPIGPDEAIAYITEHPEVPVDLTLLRDGRKVNLTVVPSKEWARVPSTDASGRMAAAHKAVGRIGVVLHGETRPASLPEALKHGAVRSVGAVVMTADWLWKMVTGQVAPQASGPIGIAAVTADQARIGWTAVASVAGLISANLAIINLLPFPPFDGFRIVLLMVEGVIRRRVNQKIEIGLTVTGIAILLGLFLVITFHDIFNLVLFQTP